MKEEMVKQVSMIETIVCNEQYQQGAMQAIHFVTERLEKIAAELAQEKERKVVNQVAGRIKSAESIYKKIKKKKYPMNREGVYRCNDLLGVRMVCLFMDDVYEIAQRLKEQPDIHILKEKDYIKKPKSNGYMSLHLLLEVPVETAAEPAPETEWIKVEVQLRTVAMDFWSVLDHQLVYKKEFPGADHVGKELKAYAATIAELDQNMLRLRGKIDALNI
jgi:putative GTP pyrophosphokinase